MNIIVPAPEGLGSPDIDYYQSIHPSQPLSAFTFASPSDQCEYSAAPTLPSAPTGWPLTPQTPGFDTFERPTYDNYSPHMSSNHDHCVMASTSGLKLLSPMADVDSESNARHYCTSIMSSPVCGGIPPSPMVEQGMFDFSQNMHYDFHPLDSYSSHALAAGGQSMGLDCVAEPSLRKWIERTYAVPEATHEASQRRTRTSPSFPYRRPTNLSTQASVHPCAFETDINMSLKSSTCSLPPSSSPSHLPSATGTSRLILKPFVSNRQRAANVPLPLCQPGTSMVYEPFDDKRLQWTDTFERSSRDGKVRAPRKRNVRPTPAAPSPCAVGAFPSVLLPVSDPDSLVELSKAPPAYLPLSPPESPALPNTMIFRGPPSTAASTLQDDSALVVGAARARKHRPPQIQIPA